MEPKEGISTDQKNPAKTRTGDINEITHDVERLQAALVNLKCETAVQYDAVDNAQAKLAEWEQKELHAVRKAFE
jgi:hypothetical protein